MNRIIAVLLLVFWIPYANAQANSVAVMSSPIVPGTATMSTYQVIGSPFTVLSGNVGSATIFCNSTDYATGGGFFNYYLMNISASIPSLISGVPRGWEVHAHNPYPNSEYFQAFVVCMKPVSVGTVVVSMYANSSSANVQASNSGFASASCKSHKGISEFVTGGGFSSQDASGISLKLLNNDGGAAGWGAGALNPTQVTLALTAFAVCMVYLPAGSGIIQAGYTSYRSMEVYPGIYGRSYAACNFGDFATGGGFYSGYANVGTSAVDYPYANYTVPNSWYVSTVATSARHYTDSMVLCMHSITISPPGPPEDLHATPGHGQVHIAWGAPSLNGSAAVSNYTIYRGTFPDNLVRLTAFKTVFNYEDNNVTNGSAYYYQITASNLVGEGPKSIQVSATPTQQQVASPPPTPPNPYLEFLRTNLAWLTLAAVVGGFAIAIITTRKGAKVS